LKVDYENILSADLSAILLEDYTDYTDFKKLKMDHCPLNIGGILSL